MEFNQKQWAQLVLFGMAQNATKEEAVAFFNKLSAPVQAQVLSLADKPVDKDVVGKIGPNSTTDEKSAGGITAEQAQKIANDAVQAHQKATRERIEGIRAVAALKASVFDEAWVNKMVAEGKTVEEARTIALNELAKDRAPVSGVRVGDDLNLSSLGPAIADALLTRANAPNYEFDAEGEVIRNADGTPKKAKVHERAKYFKGLSLMEIARHYLNAIGVETSGMARPALSRLMFNRRKLARLAGGIFASHSTSDFDNILQDMINKTLRSKFIELAPSWLRWARQTFNPDLKQISRTQLSGVGTPPLVREGGEYTYVTMSDTKEVYSLGKYGQIFELTWETLLNDDLSAFERIVPAHAAACARLEDNVAYGILTGNANMADGNALFSAAHNNITTGPGTAPSVVSFGVAKAKMRRQTGINPAEKLDIMPVTIVSGVTIETTIAQLLSSTVDPAKSNATPNPFSSNLEQVANPRIDDLASIGLTVWYLLASFLQVDTAEMCFLEGERQPQFDEEEGFDVDCRKYKVRHVTAGKAIDWRGVYRNDGA